MPDDPQPNSSTEENEQDQEKRIYSSEDSDTSRLEWVVAAVSALLVLAAAAYLLYDALGEPSTPPLVAVSVESVRPVGEGFLVEFRVVNEGDQTAAGLHVEGTLRRAGRVEETSSTTIDYVPGQGSRRGGLYFTLDPRTGQLGLRPVGYAQP